MPLLPESQRLTSDEIPSEAETLAKFQRYVRSHDPALRDELVMQHSLLVEKLARRYAAYGEPVEDLIQEGYIGLIKAVDQFDPDKGVKFTTYATHVVSGEIRHYLRDLGTLIKEPAWLQELRYRVNRARDELTQKIGRPPNVAEIADLLNMDVDEVAGVLRAGNMFYVDSLDNRGEDGEVDTIGTLDPARVSAGKAVERYPPIEDRLVLQEFINRLKELERKAIVLFFYQQHSKTEIARRLGISVNYVSYLVKRALLHLREMLAKTEKREALLRVTTMEEKLTLGALDTGEFAVTDPATGFLTRRQFQRRLREEIARARRYPQRFSIVFLRLTRPSGSPRSWDKVLPASLLAEVSEAMRAGVRQVDDLCRFQANEFAAILPKTGQSGRTAARRLAKALESLVEHRRATDRQTLAVECRMLIYPDDGDSARALMEALQQAPALTL